jgi:hypothetical protein
LFFQCSLNNNHLRSFFCLSFSTFGIYFTSTKITPTEKNYYEKNFPLFRYRNGCIMLSFFTPGCTGSRHENEIEEEEKDGYDGIEQAMLFEIERTKDPALGRVPTERMWNAIQQTEQKKNVLRNGPNAVQALAWQERGPDGDFTLGGNPRPAGQQTAGRIRAVMVDSTDPTHKTVWVGGVDGGLWKTTDITVAPSPGH